MTNLMSNTNKTSYNKVTSDLTLNLVHNNEYFLQPTLKNIVTYLWALSYLAISLQSYAGLMICSCKKCSLSPFTSICLPLKHLIFWIIEKSEFQVGVGYWLVWNCSGKLFICLNLSKILIETFSDCFNCCCWSFLMHNVTEQRETLNS